MPRTRTYGFDQDTLAFAQRVKTGSGTTILPENLKQINRFVVGLKKLGIWKDFTCWPLRSIHNAGVGSTVYSLGGFGTYNGTMINAPTWGYNGIKFDSALSKYIRVTGSSSAFNFRTSSFTVGAIVNDNDATNVANARPIIAKGFNVSSSLWSFVARNTNTFRGIYFRTSADIIPSSSVVSTLWNGTFWLTHAEAVNTNYKLYIENLVNRSDVNISHDINSGSDIYIGSADATPASYFNGTISLAYVLKNQGYMQLLTPLIRKTLAQGIIPYN